MKKPVNACLLLALAVLAWGGAAEARKLSEGEIRTIWRSNGAVQGVQEFQFGVVDWESRTVAVAGRSSPAAPTPSGKLLAKRQATADAQRNLLYLLYELRYGLPDRISSIEVEGRVVMGHIDHQGEEEDRYVVEVSLPLHRLLEECVIWKAQVK